MVYRSVSNNLDSIQERDLELVRRSRDEGDNNARWQVVLNYVPLSNSLSYAFSDCINVDPEDMVQESLHYLYERVNDYDENHPSCSLFRTFAYHQILSKIRSQPRGKNKRFSDIISFYEGGGEGGDLLDLLGEDDEPWKEIGGSELSEFVNSHVQRLPYVEKKAVLGVMEDKGLDEIAESLGVGRDRAVQYYRRAKKRLCLEIKREGACQYIDL